MAEALYGPDGFFRTQAPGDHFRTSVHVSTEPAGDHRRPGPFVEAVHRLVRRHGCTTVVDVGAGRGELLAMLHRLEPALTLIGVEVADRPEELPEPIGWTDRMPEVSDALVLANEWLDNVPVDVVEVDRHGAVRLVEVHVETGGERLGAPVEGADLRWLQRWWPLEGAAPGSRAEIGRSRDEAWADVVTKVRDGLLVAIDYGHRRDDRPPGGSLTGYRRGHVVRPVPDARCDLTAHVAMDAVADAGERAGATDTALCTQADALRNLGVEVRRPSPALVESDPVGYLRALSRAAQASELLAPGGLGGFWWLCQTVRSKPTA